VYVWIYVFDLEVALASSMSAEVVFLICYIVYLLSMFLIYEVGLLEYIRIWYVLSLFCL